MLTNKVVEDYWVRHGFELIDSKPSFTYLPKPVDAPDLPWTDVTHVLRFAGGGGV